MTTEKQSIEYMLKLSDSYFIPPFQRAYAWSRNEIERFYGDIIKIINSELDINEKDKLQHFFGTLVLKRETNGSSNVTIIVDGQQRMTTTLLFLIALRDTSENQELKDKIERSYLTCYASEFEDKIKLKQVTKDWTVYKALVNKQKTIQTSVVKNAYDLLCRLIKNNKEKIEKNWEKAIKRLNVAVIYLDERPFMGEDPQIIFETLNSLGKPLTLSDLIRNYVLLNMESSDQTEVYEKIWFPKIEEKLSDKTSEFFRDYLQYKTSKSVKVVSDNNTKEIYAIFKEYIEKRANHKEFIEDIEQYVDLYKWIIRDENVDKISNDSNKDLIIKELLRNIFHDIKTEAFKPFVMGLLYYHRFFQQKMLNSVFISDDDLISMLKIIRAYLIRRRLLNLTQGENKGIVLLCSKINDLAKYNETLIGLLTSLSYNLRFPNDDEIRKCLLSSNFYEEFKSYSKFILGKIEEHNAKVAVNFRDKRITIEHIMPQTLNKEWISHLGTNYGDVHKQYLHNIGNLILTEFNSEMGNRSFEGKKERLKDSTLFYSKGIVAQNKWTESEILKHQNVMINYFLDTFSLPEQYKHNSNYGSIEKERIIFSPLDEDSGDLARKNKPSKLKIGEKEVNVSKWNELFVKILSFFKDESDYDFDVIRENQSVLFGKSDVVIKFSELQRMVEAGEITDGFSKYKPFDCSNLKRSPNLNPEMEVVHTNASTEGIMNRIANIMNIYNIPDDYIHITLKG